MPLISCFPAESINLDTTDSRYVQIENGGVITLAEALKTAGINSIEFTEDDGVGGGMEASEITFTPGSGIASTNVQDAIEEVTTKVPSGALTQEVADARYLQLAGGMLTGALSFQGEGVTTTIEPIPGLGFNIIASSSDGAQSATISVYYDGMVYITDEGGDGSVSYIFDANGLNMAGKPITNCPSLPTQKPITLTAAGWSGNKQTVSVEGIDADPLKQIIMPCTSTEAATTAVSDYGISILSQGANTLTFKCSKVPTADVAMNVAIMPIGG